MIHPISLHEPRSPSQSAVTPLHSPSPALTQNRTPPSDSLPIRSQRVLILEHDPWLQGGLRQCLSAYPQLTVVECCSDGCSGMRAVQQFQPNLILLDLALPQLGGTTALQTIKAILPRASVLVLGGHTWEEAIAVLPHGADGYWVKGSGFKSLPLAIACVQEGAIYLDAQIARPVLQRLRPTAPHKPALNLSERELEVLQLMVKGCTNPEIAATLYLSLSTVKSHIRNIMNKLAVEDRVQVAVIALRSGLVSA